jgi:two-component system LytT family response regulator
VIRILVAEDEAPSRDLLLGYLREMPGVEIAGEASNGIQALEMAARLKPDALFLDIEMPGLKGTELAAALPHPVPRLVFVTAHAHHALEAFRLGAVHYLLKPVTRVDVAQALGRLFPQEPAAHREWLRIPVRERDSLRMLPPGEVEALVADLGDCLALTREGRLRVEGTLAQWEERLEPHGFLRIHRNALVRLGAVRSITEAGEVLLPSSQLTVGRRRREALLKALGSL